jgi:hypothetical protein
MHPHNSDIFSTYKFLLVITFHQEIIVKKFSPLQIHDQQEVLHHCASSKTMECLELPVPYRGVFV